MEHTGKQKVKKCLFIRVGWVAQLVEQRTENPCVGGSIPPPATTFKNALAGLQGLQRLVRPITDLPFTAARLDSIA